LNQKHQQNHLKNNNLNFQRELEGLKTSSDYFSSITITNKQIIEHGKSGFFHPGFAVFYCRELDKHIFDSFPFDITEKDLVLLEFKKNSVPPAGYVISIKPI
jgi:hypothetical protein